MRRFLLLLVSVLLCLSAVSCSYAAAPAGEARGAARRFAYAAAPFAATVRGHYTCAAGSSGADRTVTATVSFGAPDGGGGRELALTFSEPPALQGVTLRVTYEGVAPGDPPARTVTLTYPSLYGTVSASCEDGTYDGLLRVAEALLPTGDIADVSPVDRDGVCTVTRKDEGGRVAVFTFSKGRALPLRVQVTDRYGNLSLSVAPLA